jgi:hypothetical protein
LKVNGADLRLRAASFEANYRSDAFVGWFAISSSLLALFFLALPVTPLLRLVAVGLGLCCGPVGLVLRLTTGREMGECLTIGMPANVALIMVAAQLMVMAGTWHPLTAVVLVLDSTVALGCALVLRPRGTDRQRQ